jgi:hypothetical protein
MTHKLIPAVILAGRHTRHGLHGLESRGGVRCHHRANDTRELASPKADAIAFQVASRHMADVEKDRWANKCQENARVVTPRGMRRNVTNDR